MGIRFYGVSGILIGQSQKIETEIINRFRNSFTCIKAIWRILVVILIDNELYESRRFVLFVAGAPSPGTVHIMGVHNFFA